MFRKFIALAALGALSACGNDTPGTANNPLLWHQQPEDPEVKNLVFNQCLATAKGPVKTVYNDWDEAIDSCRVAAANVARYCPANAVCEPGAVSLEQVRAVLPRETAK